MTTTAAPTKERDVILPWDHFIKDELLGRNPHLEGEVLERAIERDKIHIERWKEMEWPHMAKELKEFSYKVSEGIEPHWVGPSRAVLWQRQTIRKRKVDESGKAKLVDETLGWTPTKGQPIGSASQLAYYLRKGLRLRPPRDGVEDVRLLTELETASSAESLSEEPEAQFIDNRSANGTVGFVTWKAYMRHCERFRLKPEYEPPDAVKRTMLDFPYFDLVRNKGFKNQKAAYIHAKEIQRKTGVSAEQTLKALSVNYSNEELTSHAPKKRGLPYKDSPGTSEIVDSPLVHEPADAMDGTTVGNLEEA